VALWDVGTRARHFAFGLISLATLFVALWVGLGNGIHKDFETPTPVRILIFSPFRLIADIIWIVLVLGRSEVQIGTLSRGICLDVDRFVCLCGILRSALFLDQGPRVSQPPENAFVSCNFSVIIAAHKCSATHLRTPSWSFLTRSLVGRCSTARK
jgi:hypothetical protein